MDLSPSSSFLSISIYTASNNTPPIVGPPHSPRSFFPHVDGGHHFLDSCHLCQKPIGAGHDIFMYRGDMPFCSEECRQEQIEMDEANEKRIKMSKKTQQQNGMNSVTPSKTDNVQVTNAGTVAAG